MKPAWDELMEEYKDSKTQLIADVDCTAGGKPLCDANGVRGYPSIKWGDPADLQDYQGGRDLASLKKFAAESLKPMCSPANIDLCDDDKKKEIEKFQKLDAAALDKLIKDKEEEQETTEKDFQAAVQKLQETYQKLNEDKDKKLAEIKDSGLGLMKAVKAAKLKADKEEL